MIKFLVNVLFFTFFTLVYSSSIDDYLLFNDAKKDFKKGDFNTSVLKFRSLQDSFKSSPIVKSNYYKYYFALSLFENGEIEKGLNYMDQAVYTPKNYSGKNFFFHERNYYLALYTLELEGLEKSKPYLLKLISGEFSPKNQEYEEFAFDVLKSTEEKLQILYNIKYSDDFSKLDVFSQDELSSIGKYFFSKKLYGKQEIIYSYLYQRYPDKKEFLVAYLNSLFLQKKADELLEISDEAIKHQQFPEIFYFRGQGFLLKKDYALAIFNLEKAEALHFKYNKNYHSRPARELIALIYSSLGDYKNLVKTLEEGMVLSKTEENLLIDGYFNLGNREIALNKGKEFLKKYPFSNNSNTFFYMASNIDPKNQTAMEDFYNESLVKKNIKIAHFILSKMGTFDTNNQTLKNNIEVKKLEKIALLEDAELLRLALENNRLLIRDSLAKNYLVTELYEIGKFYRAAYENSLFHKKIFFQYKNLTRLLYPKYHKEYVESAVKKYDIPEELLYTLILSGSSYDSAFINTDRKLGLMQINYDDWEGKNSKYSFEELFIPEINIHIGASKLKKLLAKHGNNKIKALIEYSYGEEILNSLHFEGEDFYLYSIKDPLLRESLNNLIFTYIYYKLLY
ncbi:MAG: transglycosylase SLT domain-containing protein [Fusobacteriaceae bacterium]